MDIGEMLELIILRDILKDYDTKPTYRDFMNEKYHMSTLENRYAELGTKFLDKYKKLITQ